MSKLQERKKKKKVLAWSVSILTLYSVIVERGSEDVTRRHYILLPSLGKGNNLLQRSPM